MRILLCSFLVLCAATNLVAQQPVLPLPPGQDPLAKPVPVTSHEQSAPRATAVPFSGVINIDGVLNESHWKSAEPVTQFTQLDPQEGKPGSERTEVRFLFDNDALYIGAIMHDRSPVTARLGRRDMSMSSSDWLTVILDPSHDHRTAVGFEVNPLGVRRDQTRSPNNEDDSWEPVWQVSSARSESGWTAEMRIPFSQLRFTGNSNLVWGLQIERQIDRNQEFSNWAFTPRDQPGGIQRFGHLVGITGIAAGKKLEIMPYVVTSSEHVDRGGNAFRDNSEQKVNAGVDLKYRISSNMTLDATVNPDFGQVEVDPAVINLTAFETFFPEKRPFFVEGSELFNFGTDGSNSVFYSRRIGHAPSLTPGFNDVDINDVTRILGAVKLTGRTAGGWAMGMLNAVTGEETARFRTPEGVDGSAMADPLTNYFAGRLRREGRLGQSAVGAFLGAVNRANMEAPLAAVLRKAAYTGGLDFTHQWSERTWTLNGFVAGSHVRGGKAVITGTQRLPYHYFQRPDAVHLELDPEATSLSGMAGAVGLSKRIGRKWNFNGRFNTITPGYEISDLGFERRADRADLQFGGSYNQTLPGRLRRWQASTTYLLEHNYAGDMVSQRAFVNGFSQFLNYWSANGNVSWSKAGTLDDRLTRGGPAAYRPGFVSANAFVSSDPRKTITAGFGGYAQDGPGEGSNLQWFGELGIKPRPNIEFQLAPVVAFDKAEAQFLRRVADPAATNTFGTRYVFASVDQTTVALDTRVNYTFTPALSLQVYAQPFVATGAYGAAKEFARPGSFEFLTYGEDVGVVENGRIYPGGSVSTNAVSFAVPQSDFNVRSLRGNAVLRYEWRPGSTVYFAWQQTRNEFEPIGDFSFGRDFRSAVGSKPDNVFLIKATYWLNP